MAFCPECGAHREKGAVYCAGCGHKFGEPTAQPTGGHEPDTRVEQTGSETETAAPELGSSRPAGARKPNRGRVLPIDARITALLAAIGLLIMGLVLWSTGAIKLPGGGGRGGSVKSPEAAIDYDLTPISFGGKFGFVDRSGKIVINPEFDAAGQFLKEGGLAPVGIGGKWGLINRKGKYVVNPQFDAITVLGNPPTVWVRVGQQWGTIDPNGNFIINPQFAYPAAFDKKGRAVVGTGGKDGVIDRTGRYIIPPQYDNMGYRRDPYQEIRYFPQGLAAAQVDGKWGFIKENGSWSINPQFQDTSGFDESGLAPVRLTVYDEPSPSFTPASYQTTPTETAINQQADAAADANASAAAASAAMAASDAAAAASMVTP